MQAGDAGNTRVDPQPEFPHTSGVHIPVGRLVRADAQSPTVSADGQYLAYVAGDLYQSSTRLAVARSNGTVGQFILQVTCVGVVAR